MNLQTKSQRVHFKRLEMGKILYVFNVFLYKIYSTGRAFEDAVLLLHTSFTCYIAEQLMYQLSNRPVWAVVLRVRR